MSTFPEVATAWASRSTRTLSALLVHSSQHLSTSGSPQFCSIVWCLAIFPINNNAGDKNFTACVFSSTKLQLRQPGEESLDKALYFQQQEGAIQAIFEQKGWTFPQAPEPSRTAPTQCYTPMGNSLEKEVSTKPRHLLTLFLVFPTLHWNVSWLIKR